MVYEEFQRQLGKAGLTIREFAALMRMNSNSVTNYSKAGEVPSHLAVIAALLGAMAEKRMNFRSVLQDVEISAKRPRGNPEKGRFGSNKQIDLKVSSRH